MGWRRGVGSGGASLLAAAVVMVIACAGRAEGVTATATLTLTLTGSPTTTPTATTTATVTTTVTATTTATLPSSTPTLTSTVTLPTPTPTPTLTATHSLTPSLTPTMSRTESLTMTLTVPYHSNYSMVADPPSFEGGQEIRFRIRAVLQGVARDHFNVSSAGTLDVRMYRWSADLNDRCPAYAKSGTLLQSTDSFGLTVDDSLAGRPIIRDAHVTFTAPPRSTPFVLCFKHVLTGGVRRPQYLNGWQLFNLDGTGQYLFQADAVRMWYNLPDPTLGQYAIIQLLADPLRDFNFTYPPSSCGAGGGISDATLVSCGRGDNLKIVPSGSPCTYERQGFDTPYFGSYWVQHSGEWDREALKGLVEGATAGGVGRFGTQYANPLVDEWSSNGVYWPANTDTMLRTRHTVAETAHAHHAYVYVRLPQKTGDYEVCYSSRVSRMELSRYNASGIDSLPMWRKLMRCSAKPCSTGASTTSFTVVAETVGWLVYDATPESWGTIVFHDPNSRLNTKPAGSTVPTVLAPASDGAYPTPPTGTTNYWASPAGDTFRLVSHTSFPETVTHRPTPHDTVPFGSFPGIGCWDRSLDHPQSTATFPGQGGSAEEGAPKPAHSRDLNGDPTDSASGNDLSGQKLAFTTVWLPPRWSKWYVCYRMAAVGNSGYRVLPWHGSFAGEPLLDKWKHLSARYWPALSTGTSPAPLIPYEYGVDTKWAHKAYPPHVVYTMNDTREGTFGALVLEMTNSSDPEQLDTRSWNFQRRYAAGDTIAATVGSVLRLVRSNRPCEYLKFAGGRSEGAEARIGGTLECASEDAETDTARCGGPEAVRNRTRRAAFFIEVPEVGLYRVCYRLGGWNWREVQPAEYGVRYSLPSGLLTVRGSPLTSGGLSLHVEEERGGMEALFIITSSASDITVARRGACPTPPDCENTGDVFRMVHEADRCEVTPSRWLQQRALADTHLSPYCPALSSSGMTVAPCNSDPMARRIFCQGKVCSASARDLSGMLRGTPPIFDDIVPYDTTMYSVSAAVAVLTLPRFVKGNVTANRYKLCFRQAVQTNWVVFNTTFEVAPSTPPTVVTPASSNLLGGELQAFELLFPYPVSSAADPTAIPDKVAALWAKLVPQTNFSNDNCLSPPGGTEAAAMSAATSRFRVGSTTNHIRFYLTVPQQPGSYWLCVQVRRRAEDGLSWYRYPTPFTVHDNGVRWFITASDQLVNRGTSTIYFVKCSLNSAAVCSPDNNFEVFATSPNQDAVKIIALNESCHDTPLAALDHGESKHLAVEGTIHRLGAKGVADLGPSDGPADVAEAVMTLPLPPDGDKPAEYKVCVKTAPPSTTLRGVWVEVAQAQHLAGQGVVTTASGRASFATIPALVSNWTIAEAIRPHTSLLPEAVLLNNTAYLAAVALGGASTTFIEGASTAAPSTSWKGFSVRSFNGVASSAIAVTNSFKLVLAKRPKSPTPTFNNNGSAWEWEDIPNPSCLGPAVAGTTNTAACTDVDAVAPGSCPLLIKDAASGYQVLHATFTIPLDPGAFIVCYKLAPSRNTWLWIPEGSSGSPFLYSHPTYLEFEATASNLTAYDLRTETDSYGGPVPLASWCSSSEVRNTGVPCRTLNNAGTSNPPKNFPADFISIVNDSQTCSVPSLPSFMSKPPAGWFSLIRTSNVSAAVSNTWSSLGSTDPPFALPPPRTSLTGQYKICLYKAGEPVTYSAPGIRNLYVAKQGVVYQLKNRADGAGYWADSSEITDLLLTPALTFNTSVRFAVYDEGSTQQLYSTVPPEAITEPGTGLVSHTAVIRSGTVVEVTVQSAKRVGGVITAVPHGGYAVFIEKCTATSGWESLRCKEARDGETSDIFVISNVDGGCASHLGERYGWGKHGLRQFLDEGTVTFRLQYRSGCPGGTGDMFGCGIRVVGLPTGQDTMVYSQPLWLNVEHHWPDALQLDGQEVDAAISPSRALDATGCFSESRACYMKQCWHDRPCVLSILPRYQGPLEYAPNGTLSVVFSEMDYGTFSGTPAAVRKAFVAGTIPERRGVAWGVSGEYRYTLHPQLLTADSGDIFLNISFAQGDTGAPTSLTPVSWVRFVLRVTRAVPKLARIIDVAPLDLRGLVARRTPSPSWEPVATQGKAFVDPAPSLTAVPGSYLESLVPYELQYEVCGDEACNTLFSADPSSLQMDGYNITASVSGAPENAVLQVHYTAASDGAVMSPANLLTAPPYVKELRDLSIRNPGSAMSKATTFRQWFRVKNNIGCSRFTPIPGCDIVFTLRKGDHSMHLILRTAVRVVAQTLKIDGTVGSPPSPTAPLSEGVLVTVIPGTYDVGVGYQRWLTDEFHYGDIFALINTPSQTSLALHPAGSPTAQCMGNTTASCVVWRYPLEKIDGTWGARMHLRSSRPCMRCEVTFHSTWGASPESYSTEGFGTATFSFTDDSVGIRCQATEQVAISGLYIASLPGQQTVSSEKFDIHVTPVASTGANAMWPRWWVFIDARQGVLESGGPFTKLTLRRGLSSGTIISARMRYNQTSHSTAAVFTGLVFEGASMAAERHTVQLVFQTVASAFDDSAVGSVVKGTTTHTCSINLVLNRGDSAPATRFVQIREVTGATPLCETREGCTLWYTTTTSGRLSVDVWFNNRTSRGTFLDTTPRNFTIQAPAGGSAVTWQCSERNTPCTANPFKLASPGENADLFTGTDDFPGTPNTHTYHFGSPLVSLSRLMENGTAALKGQGSFTIEQQGVPVPANGISMSVCAAVNNGGVEQVDTSTGWENGRACVDLTLWILPPDGTPKKLAIFKLTSKDGTNLNPGTASCGHAASRVDLTAITYYTIDGKRYIVYDTPIQYFISHRSSSTQEGNMLSPVDNPFITNQTISTRNRVPTGASKLELLRSTYDMRGYFRFYGLSEKLTAAPFVVAAKNLDRPDDAIAPTTTMSSYKWTLPSEIPYSGFTIHSTVTTDDECPGKRFFAVTTRNYRSFGAPPGKGWAVGHAAVGIPFPVQVSVTTHTINGVKQPTPSRAWTFKRSLVFLTKHSWKGCNDGGTVKVLQMRQTRSADTTVMLPTTDTSIQTFITPEVQGAVYTTQGVATLWPQFSAPCQACVLEAKLCYTTATSLETCLEGSGDLNHNQPVFAERIKYTKPFSVEKPSPSSIHVVSQTTPNASLPVKVGEPFEIDIETVQHFSGWAVDTAPLVQVPMQLWVVSRWNDSGNAQSSSAMKYGNGGFLIAGVNSQPCSLSDGDVLRANRTGAFIKDTVRRLTFYFTRPCSRCDVWFRWRVGSSEGSFPLRDFSKVDGIWSAGNVLSFRVVTCGTQWMIAGVPPRAVRRMRPFSLSVHRVDGSNFPDWSSLGGPAPLLTDAEGFAAGGNGGGGGAKVTSPDGIPLQDGTATVRVELPRACYTCTVGYGLKMHTLTVLTQATQLIAIPQSPSAQNFTSPGSSVSWSFEVYAADELGDRDYTIGGPTPLVWQPVYQQRVVAAGLLGIQSMNRSGLNATILTVHGGRSESVTTSMGTPVATISRGASVVNGIPYDPAMAVPPGVVNLTLEGSPVVRFEVAFTIDGVAYPTRHLGQEDPPIIDWVIPPDRLILDAPPGMQVKQGVQTEVRAYAVARLPGATDASFVVSATEKPLTAVIEIDCISSCLGGGVCEVLHPVTADTGNLVTAAVPFVRGVAVFPIQFSKVPSGGASCTVTVREVEGNASLSNAVPQVFQLEVQPQDLSQWAWVPSPSFSPVWKPPASSASSSALANATTILRLRVFDQAFTGNPIRKTLSWPSSSVVMTVDPPRCLHCVAPSGLWGSSEKGCRVELVGSVLPPEGVEFEVEGKYPVHGECRVTAIDNLPVGSLAVPLVVRVHGVVGMAIPHPSNFTGLSGIMEGGEPAAVVGRAVSLEVRMLQEDGSVAFGDHHTTIELSGTSNSTVWSTQQRVKAGVSVFAVSLPAPTRACPTCPHSPWYFTATAVRDGKVIDEIVAIGPLYVVPAASALEVQARFGDKWVDIAEGNGTGEVHFVWGYNFSLRVVAVERSDNPFDCPSLSASQCAKTAGWCSAVNGKCTGPKQIATVPENADETGSSAYISFRPVAIPCHAADRTNDSATQQPWLRETCLVGGACRDTALPPCGTGGWELDEAVSVQGHELVLEKGSVVIQSAKYVAPRHEGAAYFMLSTTDLLPSEYTFLGGIAFQAIARLEVEGSVCTGGMCTLPAFMTVVRSANMSEAPRAPAFTPFNITLVLVDLAGNTVGGDSFSSIRLVPTCHSPSFSSLFSMGVVGGITGQLVTQPSGWDNAPVVRGVAVFRRVGFGGVCPNASLVFRCNTSSAIDPLGTCSGQSVGIAEFEVGDSSVPPSPPTPVPSTAPPGVELPSLVLDLGPVDIASFGNSEKALFETRMENGLKLDTARLLQVHLRLLCSVAKSEAAQGITLAARLNPNICRSWARPASHFHTTQSVCFTNCTTLVEFEVALPSGGDNDPTWHHQLFGAVERVVQNPVSEIRQAYPALHPSVVQTTSPTLPPSPTPASLTPSPTPPLPRATPMPEDTAPQSLEGAPSPLHCSLHLPLLLALLPVVLYTQ